MRSILFEISTPLGHLQIRGYGLMLAFAFLCGIYLAVRRGKQVGIKRADIVDLSLYIIIAAVIGARFAYVLFHWNEFSESPLDIVNPFGGDSIGISGLVFYGGLILSIFASVVYTRKRNISFWKMADVMAPSIALGIFFTRIGCFLNGCCFGRECDLAWGVVFPDESLAGYIFPDAKIHPTQIYSSLYGLGIFGILTFIERFKSFDGFTFWSFVGLYSIARFSVDFLRYYDSMILFNIGNVPMNANQGLSAVLFFTACGMFLVLRKAK